jgi:hypothetical protein
VRLTRSFIKTKDQDTPKPDISGDKETRNEKIYNVEQGNL